MYDAIDIKEIDSINIDNNLVDIRDKYEYVLSHINNAINIPYTYLLMMPENYLDKNKKYYLYCDSGTKSRKMCEYLNEQGFQTIDLIGGYNSYLNKSI